MKCSPPLLWGRQSQDSGSNRVTPISLRAENYTSPNAGLLPLDEDSNRAVLMDETILIENPCVLDETHLVHTVTLNLLEQEDEEDKLVEEAEPLLKTSFTLSDWYEAEEEDGSKS